MRVLIDWDQSHPALFLRFDASNGIEVPDDMAMRWRDIRDAWWALAEEVRAFEEGLHGFGSVTQ